MGVYSTPGCAGCVQHMPEPGLRGGVIKNQLLVLNNKFFFLLKKPLIGFLSPINILPYSTTAVTDSGGSHAKGSIGAFPSSGPLQGRIF